MMVFTIIFDTYVLSYISKISLGNPTNCKAIQVIAHVSLAIPYVVHDLEISNNNIIIKQIMEGEFGRNPDNMYVQLPRL